MTRFFFLLFVVGLLPFFVSAHGYLGSVDIDGKSYPGNNPGGATNPSIIRQVSSNGPVKPTSNPSLSCGLDATKASDVANANPGSQIVLHWVGGTTGATPWVHRVGPIMTYMAKCSGACSSYDSSNAEWFKISQLGIESGSTWYQNDIADGKPTNVTIPSNIAPGDYLLRTELISLQNAVSVGGAEFYPACVQLSIGGSGTGAPTSSEECKFPGGYSDNDPGIYTPNIYNPPINYVFPGPPVAAFVGTGGTQGGSQQSGSAGGSSATPTAGSSSPTPSNYSVPANASSHSSTPTSTHSSSTPVYSAMPSGNATASNLGASCYLKSRSEPLLAKRGGWAMHKRRLVRRGD